MRLKISSFLPFPSPRHTTPEKFFIEACDEGADAVLAIDRVSNEMTLTGRLCSKVLSIAYDPKTLSLRRASVWTLLANHI